MIVIVVLVVVIVLFVAILLINAARVKPTPIENPLPPSTEQGTDRAVERFQEMVRIKTVWGAEDPNADHTPFDEFVPKMKELYPTVFSTLELTMINTYGIMLKWSGINEALDPIVLMAHHDVVEVNAEEWSHDPFGAEIADGKIWGRGTVDTKCILAGLFEATETLIAEGYTPPRDIYLCSSNCEEDNGDTTPKMVEYFNEQGITPYMVLDEGGAVINNAPLGVRNQFAVIGVAEKGLFNAHITTNSKGGHAATPSDEDSTAKLVGGLESLLKHTPPAKLSSPVRAMLKELAAYGSFSLKVAFGNMGLFKPIILAMMKASSESAAMVHTTYAVTELEGSKTSNVLPKQAKATVNIRVDPSENVKMARMRLEVQFAKDTEFVLKDTIEPSPIAPFEDPAFDYLRNVIHSVYPNTGIAPYVQSSCSDARHMHLICPRTYRFAGFLFKGDQRARIHGSDENLDIDSFKTGIGFYTELIRHFDLLGK